MIYPSVTPLPQHPVPLTSYLHSISDEQLLYLITYLEQWRLDLYSRAKAEQTVRTGEAL